MNLVIVILVLLTVSAILGIYLDLEVITVGLVWGVSAVIFSIVQILRWATVIINEREIGVIFYTHGNFSRFVGSGRQHMLPFLERLEYTIPIGQQWTNGQVQMMRTKEGIPVTIGWNVGYKIDIDQLLSGPERTNDKVGLAYGLKKRPPTRITTTIIPAIRAVIEQRGIQELYTDDIGALKQLTEAVTTEIRQNLEGTVYLINQTSNVVLGPIEMPADIEDALNLAYERKLHTSAVVEALKELKEVISGFEDSHMHRLAELERLRIIGKNGTSLAYKSVESHATLGNGPVPAANGAPNEDAS